MLLMLRHAAKTYVAARTSYMQHLLRAWMRLGLACHQPYTWSSIYDWWHTDVQSLVSHVQTGARKRARHAAVAASGEGEYSDLVIAELKVAQQYTRQELARNTANALAIQGHLALQLSGAGFPPQRAGGLCTLALPTATPTAGGCLVPGCTSTDCEGNRVTVNPGNGCLGFSYQHLKNSRDGSARDIYDASFMPTTQALLRHQVEWGSRMISGGGCATLFVCPETRQPFRLSGRDEGDSMVFSEYVQSVVTGLGFTKLRYTPMNAR